VGKRPLGIPRRRWEYNDNPLNAELNPSCHLLALLEALHILHVGSIRVKMDLQEVGWGGGGGGGMDWIDVAQDRDWWIALVNGAMDLRVP